MGLGDLLLFENLGFLAILVTLLLFFLVFIAVHRAIRNRGIAVVIALAVSFIAGWNLYKNEFYGMDSLIAILIIAIVVIILVKIGLVFIKHTKSRFGRIKTSEIRQPQS